MNNIVWSIFLSMIFLSHMAHAQMPPANVLVQPVIEDEFQNYQKAVGTLRAHARAELAVREQGAVEQVFVDEGDYVKQGQVLVEFDARRLKAQLEEAKAALATAKSLVQQRMAEVERANSDYDMKAKAHQSKAISLSDVLDAKRMKDVSQSQLASSKDAVQEVQSRIDLIDVRLEDMKLTAPFDGLIVEKNVDPGEWLNPGTVIFSLIAIDEVEAWITVPERLLLPMKTHQGQVKVFVEALNKDLVAKDITIIPDVNPQTRMFTVIATIDNKDHHLQPGMSIQGLVPTGTQSAYLAVSSDAVLRSDMGSYVFIAQPGQEEGQMMAQNVPIQELFSQDDLIIVQSPMLKKGQMVIVEGNQRLMPMSPIITTEKK